MRGVLLRKKIEFTIFLIMLCSLFSQTQAKVRTVKSDAAFNEVIGRYSHSVVLFYDSDRAMRKSDPNMYAQNNRLEATFKAVANRGAYQEARIQFFLVNVSKDGLWSTAQGYGFKDYPVCVLFKNGRPLSTNQAQKSIIRGFFNADQLHAVINTCWGDDIDQLVQERQEERREIDRERAAYAPSIGFGFGYGGYPYYGGWGYPYYGGYWGRPRFGFGIGF